MALYSTDDKLQNTVGKKEYWKAFHRFENSKLHGVIVKKLEALVDGSDTLNSMHIGSNILTEITTNQPDLLEKYEEQGLGGLFGMTMWNYLAKADSSWYFHRESKAHDDQKTGTIYFRRK